MGREGTDRGGYRSPSAGTSGLKRFKEILNLFIDLSSLVDQWINTKTYNKQIHNWLNVFHDILFTFLVFTDSSLDMSESGKSLAYMTHYWDQKTRLSVNAHDDSAKMKTGKETLKEDAYSGFNQSCGWEKLGRNKVICWTQEELSYSS